MGEHRALRRAGRARGEHDLRDVVRLGRRQRPIRRRAPRSTHSATLIEATRPRGGSGSRGRRSATITRDVVAAVFGITEHAGGTRLRQDVLDLTCSQHRVHRYQHQARHRRREREHERLGECSARSPRGVHRARSAPRARADRLGLGTELRVGAADPCRRIGGARDQRDTVGSPRRRVAQDAAMVESRTGCARVRGPVRRLSPRAAR